MGQYAEARTHFQSAADISKEVGAPILRNQALTALAYSWAFEGQGQRSLSVLQTVRQQQLDDGDVLGAAATARTAGRLLLETGDVENGRTWYERGYEESKPPDSASDADKMLWEMRLRHARARIACKQGNIAEAQQAAGGVRGPDAQARARWPTTTSSIAGWLGHVAYYEKDYDTAIAQLSRGNLQDPFVLDLLARCLRGQGRHGQRPALLRAHDWRSTSTTCRRRSPVRTHGHGWPRSSRPGRAVARPHARSRLVATDR